METKHRVSTKILSLFLSVLMAFSCFAIALPNLAGSANAAATADQWKELTDAFTAAYSGGYFSTDSYAVSDDGAGNVTVADTTVNGYIYDVVRAIINVAAAEKSEENDHNATIRESVKTQLAAKMDVSPAMNEFIDSLLPVPAEGAYSWYADNCWQGAKDDALKPTADVTNTVTVTRTVKSAILTDYEDAAAVPEKVETEYKLTTKAKAYQGTSSLGDDYCTVWYQNDSMTASAGMSDADDLSAIVAYNTLVNDADWQADYAAYNEDELSVYQKTTEELNDLYNDYVEKENAANACDPDYVEKFIGAEYMNAYRNYMNFCYSGKDIPSVKKYVDWIQGVPINNIPGFEDSLNKLNYKEDDREAMLALIAQAQNYYSAINATGAATINILVNAYGYDTNAYADYIAELTAKVQKFDLTDILVAFDYISTNSAPAEYTFPEGSQFYTEDSYDKTSDTAVNEESVYYTLEVDENGKESYKKVDLPEDAQLGTYYEYTPHYSVTALGNDTFYSQPYVEAGQECPVDDTALTLTYSWLNSALSIVNSVPVDTRKEVISDAILSEMNNLRNYIEEEGAYRGFDENSQTFADEYAYFVKLKLSTGLTGMSDIALYGRADDTSTEVNEYVEGLIAEATRHYNLLSSAYNTCAASCSNTNVKNRYAAFVNQAYAYIGSIYKVLFDRCYAKLNTIRGYTSGGINASNFSLVKGGVAGFDEDPETDGMQNSLYSWLVANRGTVESRGPVASGTFTDMVNIYNSLASWKSTADSFGAGGWGSFGSRYYCDGNTGTYVTRAARADDMVRYVAGNGASSQRYEYTVTNTKIETVISKLDTFLKSDSFIKLIGMYDPSEGVTDLTTFIEDILVKNVFTNDIVNMIVAALFPMVCNLLENELRTMLREMKFNNVPVGVGTAGGYDFSWDVVKVVQGAGADLGDLSLYSGVADGAFNGTQGTTSFASVFSGMGVNIYPSAFRNSLADYINGVYMGTFKSRLSNAGNNWQAFDSTSYGGDGNGTLDGDDLAWVDWGVRDFDTACTALGEVFKSILPLVRCLFCNYTFSAGVSNLLYVRIRDGHGAYDVPVLGNCDFYLDGTSGYASGTLRINGVQGFNNLWAPLVEGLGVQTYSSSYAPTVSNAISTTIGTSGAGASASQIVQCLLMPIYALIKQVAANPLSTVTKILPNISYAVSYNLIQPLLNALNLSLNIDANLDINNKGSINALASWLDVGWIFDIFKGPIQDAINNALNFDVPLELGSMLDLGDLLGVDISNLNAIAGMIFGMLGEEGSTANKATLPAINSAYLGRLGDLAWKTGSPRNGGGYYYINADRADVLYDLIKWVLTAAQDGSLMGLLGALGVDSLPAGIDDLLKSVDVNGAIAALVELFLPRGLSGSGYSTGYDMADYNWYRPGVSASNYNLTSASFVYLKYANDWTAEKADYVYNHVDEVATAVLKIVDEDLASEFTGISDFVLDLVNSIFNNYGVMNVIDLLVSLGTATESEDQTIANLIKEQIKVNGQNINIDIRSWFNSFGYMDADSRILADGEFVYTNKNGTYCVGVDGDTALAGIQPEFVRSYPLAPSGFGGFQKVSGEYIPVASNGTGRRGEVTSYYKYTKNATTKEITYTLTSGVPDNSYVNGYPNLQVAFGEKDEDNDCYWHWKVKGNSYTASGNTINLANGMWYDLIDDSENARAVFTAIFCDLMKPLMGVIGLILTGDDLSVFNNALTIKGYQCYDGAIIPVMEMLGVTGLKTQAQYSADYKMAGSGDPNGKAAAGFYYLVSKLFDSLGEILSYDYNPDGTVKKAPVQKLIELLPGIFYFFQSDGLSTLIKNLLMPVWVLVDTIRPIADADLDDFIHQFLCNTLGLTYDKSNAAYASAPLVDFILNLIGLDYIPYSAAQAAKDKQIVDAVYSLTLKDLSLNTVYKVVEILTGLDLAPLTYAFEGMCAGYTDIKGVAHGVHADPASAYQGTGTRSAAIKQRYTLDYYGPDIITVTISVLLDLLRYQDNAKALDELIGLTSDYFQGATLSDMTAEGLLEALTFIFEDKDASAKEVPNWDYLLEQDSIAIRRPTDGYAIAWVDGSYDLLQSFSDMTPYHSIYNLAYKTDWTYDTSKATDNLLATVLDYLTVSTFAKDNEDVTSFAGFIDGLLNDMVFSGETLRAIAGLMAQLYNFIPAEIIAMVDALLDIKMTAWLGKDGYDTELIKQDVKRSYSDILSNSVIEIDLDEDGEISDTEKFDKYEIKANGTVIDETYVPVVGAKIEKTLMTVDEHGNYEAYKDEDGEKDVSYYIIGEVEDGAVVWSNVADEDFALDASEYVANYDWGWWADPTAAEYVDTRAEFIDALEQILAPSATLFSFIFLERDYELLYTAGDNLGSTSDDNDAIILDGIGAYGDAVVPLFEALGIPMTKAQYETLKAKNPDSAAFYEKDGAYIGGAQGFAPSKYYNASATTNADKYDGELWLSDMMDLFIALADEILADPINWILNKMPGLIYFINADGVTTCLKNLFGDVNDILDAVNSMLDRSDRINLGNLAGINLSNLTLSGIFDIIYDFTGIYVREDLRDYMNNLFIGTLSSFWSANGTLAFTMDYNTEEDRADFITILLSMLVEILEDEGDFIDAKNGYNYTHYSNPMAIDHLVNSDLAENEGGMVTDILNAVRNPESVVYADIDWNYFDESYDLVENTDEETNNVTLPGYAFQYLNYTTQWKYVSALSTAEGFEDLILGVLGMVDEEKFGSMESLSELINMETVYTAETLQGILDMIAPFLYGEDAVLNEALLLVIGTVLGADLTQWNGKYAFASELTGTVAHDDEVGLDYAVMPNYVLTTDTAIAAGKTYYVLGEDGFETVASPVVDDINEYYEYKNDVKTYLINDDESFGAGLALILKPAEKLLGWLLFGDDYTFFNGNTDKASDEVLITIQGSHGYKEGLALLLEAFGFNGLKKESYYLEKGMNEFVKDLVGSVINRLNTIIDDPVNEIIALIPELIYFVNANGLAVSIQNLLAGPLTLVNQLTSLFAEEGETPIYDPSDPNKVINDLVTELLQDGLKSEDISFKLENVNLKWIMEVAEAVTGMEITDVVQGGLDNFYMGKLTSYTSKSEKLAYKMAFDAPLPKGNGDFADFITILLSFVIDVATYPGNASALIELLNGDKTAEDEGYIDPSMIQSVLDFIKNGYVVYTDNIDWFYFDDSFTIHTVNVDTEKDISEYTYAGAPFNPGDKITVPKRTINYLTYASDWTAETADYIATNRNEIVAAVLKMAGMGETTVADIVKGLFDPAEDLYTGETLNAIFDLVAPVLADLPEVLLELANIILDIDLSFYTDEANRFDETKTYTRQEFVNGLCDMLSPLDPILDWLLFGEAIQYFDRKDLSSGDIDVLLDLPGAEGYKFGLVPILEALGVNLPAVDDDDKTEDVLFVLINNVLARVEAILDNPVDEVLELLPNLLYFINTNGLAICVKNLLAGPFALLDAVNDVLPEEDQIDIGTLIGDLLNGLPITIDLEKLDLMAILTIVEEITAKNFYKKTADTAVDADKTYYIAVPAYDEVEEADAAEIASYYEKDADGVYALTTDTEIADGKTYYTLSDEPAYEKVETPAAADLASYYEVAYTAGIKLKDVFGENKIENFYLGQLEYYASANGQPAFKMVYSADEGMKDMLTVIANLAVEVLLYDGNADAIDALINGVDKDGKPAKSTVKSIVDIILGLKDLTDIDPADINWNYFDETVTLGDEIVVPGNAFVYLDYANEWTYDKAAYLDTGLEQLVNEILALTAAEGEEPKTVTDLVKGLVDLDSIMNADLLNSLLDLVAPLLYGENSFLNSYLLNVIGLVLGADLTTWDYSYRFEAFDEAQTYGTDPDTGLKYRTGEFTVGDKTYENKKIFVIKDANDFATGLAYILAPASRVLGWFLLGQDYGFFVDNATASEKLLTVPGFNGYDSAIVLLLEALGCELKSADTYFGNEDKLIKDIIDALLARVDEILSDPIDEVLGLIPELLYFINAGGLNAVVQNLAGGVFTVIDYVNASGLLEEPIELDLNDLLSGAINEAYAKMNEIEVEDITDPYEFKLEEVTLQTVIDVAEMFTGLSIGDAIGYSLAKFAIGEVSKYETASAAYADNAYKMQFAATGNGTEAHDRADMITIVISVVLDVLRYDGNAAALAALLEGVMDGKITEDVIKGVVDVIDGYTIPMMDVEWLYPIANVADITTVDGTTEIEMVDRTINYLSYGSDWTEETAEYVIDNLDAIIAAVLNLAGQEESTVAEILAKSFKVSDFYTAENLNKIVELVSGLTEKLGATLTNLAGMIIADDAIYDSYADMEFSDSEINSRETFANGLAKVIAPIGGLLDWILFGKDLAFFYDNDYYGTNVGSDLLVLSGAEGYAYGLVPLLEALGVEGLPEITATTTTNDVLADIIDAVLNRVEVILADPEDEVIALLPNLLYFINANGLSVAVNNLLGCVLGLVDAVNPVIEDLDIEITIGDMTVTKLDVNAILNSLLSDTLNGYDELDVKSLKLLDIVKVVEAVTGLKIADVVTDMKLENFYLGKVEYFKSNNGKAAFKMGYTTEEDKHDMITVLLNFLVEVALTEGNSDALIELLDLGDDTKDVVDTIIELITGKADPYDYSEFNWNYADGTIDLGADVIVPKDKFIYLAYKNNWTIEKAQLLDAELVKTVDTVIGMIKPGTANLSDMIAGLVDLDELVFNAETLNKIYDLVSGLLYGEDAVIASALSEAAGLILGADLTEFNDLYTFEAMDAAKTYLTDSEFGLEYRVVNGKAIYAIDGSESFINGLVRILKPAEKLLGWLLMGEEYGFFVDNATGTKTLIKIEGGEGYAKGLALLLEALGVKGLEADYADASEMLRAVLTALVARVEEILTNPVDEVLALIPELIYFINANGLGVVVNNLAAAAFNILDAVIETGLIKDVTDRNEWINGLLGDIINNALESDIKFDLNAVNMQCVIDLAEIILAKYIGEIKINEVLADSILGENYPLSLLQIGAAVKYESASAFDTAYRCDFSDGINGADRADMLTILLSFVIDFARNETNQATIEDLAGLTAGTISDVLDVLTKYAVKINPDIDWFYFDPGYTYSAGDDLKGMVPSINYLTYASDWSDKLATYLDKNLDEIIAEVFKMIGKEDTTVADLIKGVFDPNAQLYTAANLNKIAALVADLLTKLSDGLETLVPTAVELLLDVDLHAWDGMTFEEGAICDKETFIDGLYEVLEPIFPVLDWILFDEDYAFFNRSTAADNVEDLIVLNGYAGYAEGLVPLLEALGVTLESVADPTAADYSTAGQLKGMLEAVLARVEGILANPVEEVLALIPNVLYFINANGLASAVNNLLGVALQLVDKANVILHDLGVEIALDEDTKITSIDVNFLVNHFVGDKLNGYVVDTQKLDLIEIIKVVEALTGLDLESFVRENGIEEFYVGQITYFESANGKPAFKMVYSEDEAKDRHDLITIVVNYLIEAVLYGDNAEVIDELIGKPGMVASIVEMLNELAVEPVPGDFHWGYFNEDADDVEPTTNLNLPKTPFINHLTYATDWTQNTADTLKENLDDVITAVLTIIAGDDETKAHNVADLINGSFSLYKAEYLNAILDLTSKLYDLMDEKLVNVLGMVLGCDLSSWNGLKFTDDEIYDHDTFVNGLVEILEPISGILDWLLFGDGYNFFVEDAKNTDQKTLVNIAGAKGYINGLAPILLALGVDLPYYEDSYSCKTEVGGKIFLKAVLEAVFDRVDDILKDPVDEVLDLLPGLLYFINANGVSTAAYNIAGGVLNAVNVLTSNGVLDLGGATIEEFVETELGLNIKNLDLEGIIKFLEAKVDLKGIKIYDVFMGNYTVDANSGDVAFTPDTADGNTNILEKFYVGEIEEYNYSGITVNKMVNKTGEGKGDIITMLLSIVLDVLFYDDNEQPIADLINGLLGDDVTFTKDNFVALKGLLMSGADFETSFGADWVYFLDLDDAARQAKIEEILSADVTAVPELPERTQHYLEYDNNWNVATVDYLDENINDIVDLVINMITNGESETLEELIEDNLDLYTTDMAQTIIDKIAGLIAKLDDVLTEELKDKLLVTAGSLLSVDIKAVTKPVTEIDDNADLATRKAQFVSVLADRFGNLERVLNWLLFDEDLEFFTSLEDGIQPMIVIAGGEGYKYGLAPILAALGVDTKIDETLRGEEALAAILTKVADRIDELLYGGNGKKTLDEVLALLPELIYFINTGAISNCVMNLLQPADELLATVNKNLGDGAVLGKNSVNDLITAIDLEHIDFDFLFDLVLDKTNIDIANSTGTPAHAGETLGKVGDYIKSFYFGQLETYTSYGDVFGVRMNYSTEDTRMDMLTILVTLVLDVATSGANKEALVDLLGSEETYNVILALLTGGEVEIEYSKFNFLFTEFADTGIIVSPMTADGSIYQSLYGPLYTRAMGEYMTKYLQLVIDTYITLLGVQIDGVQVTSLEALLDNVLGGSIYTNDILNTVYEAIYNLIIGLKEDTLGEELFNHIANVLNSSLGVDLNYWTDYEVATITDGDQTQFIDEICRMLRPAYPILKWLFTADKIALFNKDDGVDGTVALDDNDYIYLQGAEGYKYAIVPILEALNNGDTSNVMAPSAYMAAVEADATGDALLKNILKPILDKVDAVLADPINGVLNLLPAVVYFVNSKGLDTCFKNLLGAVYMLLEKIDPLIADVENLHKNGKVSLYPLIGLDLEDLDLETLLRELLDGLKDSTGFELSDIGIDLVKELTMGVIESYNSQINEGEEFQTMYTMKYATEGYDQNGNKCDVVDFVTILLRLVLRFISDPTNKDAVEALLADKLSGDGYTLLCSLLDNFSMMVRTNDGIDKVMYTVYYIFYGALCAGVATNNGLAEFNGNYSFLNQLFATSDVAFIRQIEKTMGDWLNKWGGSDLVDEDEVIPNGQISFWQKIIDFFKKIISFFKNLFN